MPSVMRRSTRVFVPKSKDGEGVRVLRSGRKLWIESTQSKVKGVVVDGLTVGREKTEDLFRLINHNDAIVPLRRQETKGFKGKDRRVPKPDLTETNEVTRLELPNMGSTGEPMEVSYVEDKKYGKVYCRKRKKSHYSDWNSKADLDWEKSIEGGCGSKKFGLQFFRRQRRRTEEKRSEFEKDVSRSRDRYEQSLCISAGSSFARRCRVSSLLSSVLRYMSIRQIRLAELSSFLVSQPLSAVFASCGIYLCRGHPCQRSYGICKIYGIKQSVPMFKLEFDAVPPYFIGLHLTMWFRSAQVSYYFLLYSDNSEVDEDDDDFLDVENLHQLIRSRSRHSQSSLTDCGSTSSGNLKDFNSVVLGLPRSPNRCLPLRNGINSRLGQRSGRRSLKTRRARNPSLLGVQRGSNGSLLPDTGFRKKFLIQRPLHHEAWKHVQKRSSESELKSLRNELQAMGDDIDKISCGVNVLIVESDRCYRDSGASVVIQHSSSGDWVLAVKRDGFLRCTHKAQKGKEMKPSSTNRHTCAIIWAVESGWKLEFTERREWVIFKELYKVCGDRNALRASSDAIPIPVVREVSLHVINPNPAPPFSLPDDGSDFSRPVSYIRVNDDELSRTLLRRTANYDMDSEDEEWLNNTLNNSKSSDQETAKLGNHVPWQTFELMIDAFEKARFCDPDDSFDENAAVNLCAELGKREVVEAVYSYYSRKRKQKRSPLLRTFQLNEPVKSTLASKSVLRKKRSIKQRQPTTPQSAKTKPTGRGKEIGRLQAIIAEKYAAVEERGEMLKVQEAKANAKRLADIAIAKRQRAQQLMETADLAMYRAAMAVRLSEAVQVAAATEHATAHFIDLS